MNVSTQGETRRLDCQVIGWPVPDVIWLKDEIDITRDARYRYTFDGEAGLVSLFIDDIQPSDSGWYTCVALNEHGSVVVRSLLVVRGPDGSVGNFADRSALDDARVIEIAKQRRQSASSSTLEDAGGAPRFISITLSPPLSSSSSQTRYIGDSLIVDCGIAGNPTPSISWIKDGKTLSSGASQATYRFEAQNERRRLLIDSLSASDGGDYVVRLENANGVAEHQFHLDVKRREKPSIGDDSSAHVFEVVEGDHVVITFQLRGQPPPQINWLKDGRVLTTTGAGQRVKLETNEQRQEIMFELAYAERSDAGHYECLAQNSEGKTQRKFELIVKGGVMIGTVDDDLQLNEKQFQLVADTQLFDAATGELHGAVFPKGTRFAVKDGQSARNWLVTQISPDNQETSPLLFFVPPSLMVPVEIQEKSPPKTLPDTANLQKRKSIAEVENEFIDDLSKLLSTAPDWLLAMHRKIAENAEKTDKLEQAVDEALAELFQAIAEHLSADASTKQTEQFLHQIRAQNQPLSDQLLPVVIRHLEYYVKTLQELPVAHPERSKEISAVITRIIRFEKTLADRPFISSLIVANDAPAMATLDQSGKCVRHDVTSAVKGPQGWKLERAEVALFESTIHVIEKTTTSIQKTIKLTDCRITEFSEKSLFINLQNQTAGFRWTFTFPTLTSYLCFLRELIDCGTSLALKSATSAQSVLSAQSSEDLTGFQSPSANSGDEFLTADEEEEETIATIETGDTEATVHHSEDEETIAPPPDEKLSVTPEPSFQPSFTCDAKQLQLVEGQANQIALSFIGQPKPSIQWLSGKDRKPLPAIKGLSTAEEGNLAILKVEDAAINMTGTYICQITNASGTAELPVEITVKPNAELRKPRFIKQLSDTSVSEDGSLTLTTEYSCETVKNVEWLLNGQTITTETVKTVKVTTTEKSSTLYIEKIEKTFSGAVSCVVTNEYGQATSTCGVSVRPAKKRESISITTKVSKAEIPEGDDFIWACAVKAPEPFGVTWSKVGEVCDQETLSRISLETVGNDRVLFHIRKVQITDSGTYRCTLTYEEQVSSCEVTLGVFPSNDVPEMAEGPTLDRVTHNSVSLSWPKLVVTNKTITYTVEQTVTNTGEWTIARSKVEETKCEVADLAPNLEYWFRIYAEDTEGRRGKPSPAVGYFTGEEVPIPDKPSNAKLEQVAANHWIMSWEPPAKPGPEELTYLIEIYDEKQSIWRKLASGVQKTKLDMKQLKSDQLYKFRIRALNSAGLGEPSDELIKPVEKKDDDLPSPAKLILVELSPTLVWLIWQPPPNAEGLVYVIEAQDASTGEWCRLGEHGVTETRIELNNLLEGEEYKFRVRSFQEATQRLSSPSNEVCRPAKWSGGEPLGEESERQITEETTLEEVRQIAAGVIEEEFVSTSKQERVQIIESDESVKTVTEEIVTESKSVIQHPVSPIPEVPEVQEAPKLPPTPINVKIEYKPDNVACLEWQSGEPNGEISEDVTFVVETKVKNDQWNTIVQNIKATNIDLKGLKMERDYFFRIRAKGLNGLSEPSEPIRCRLEPPKLLAEPPKITPQHTVLEEVNPKTVKLAWDKPDEGLMAQQQVTGFKVEAIDKSADKLVWKEIGSVSGQAVTSYTVEQLDEEHEYEFRVCVFNAAGAGVASQPVVRKAHVAPQTPPTELHLEKVDAKSVKLTWKSSEQAKTYRVEVMDKAAKKAEWVKVAEEITDLFAPVQNLEPSHEYELRVIGVTEAGVTIPSQPIIRQAALPPQSAPTELKLEKVDSKSVKLSWKSVEEATKYRVEMMDKSAKKPEWKVAEEISDVSAVVKNLEPTKEYELRVIGINESGVGVPSQPIIRQAALPPQKPPTELKLENVDAKTAKLSWNSVEDAQTYRVEIMDRAVKKADWKKVAEEVSEPFMVVPNLDPTHEYELRVAAVSESGVGVPSQPIVRQAKKAPQKAPTEVQIENVNPQTVRVKWSPLKDDADVAAYTIETKSPTEKEWRAIGEVQGALGDSYEVADLKGDAAYEFRVIPTNEAGKGAASKAALRAPQIAPATAPLDVKVVDTDGVKARVEWKKIPEASRGYSVQILEPNTTEWKERTRTAETSGGVDIKDLDAFKDYSFRVAGVNEIGPGTPSEPVKRAAREKTPLRAVENVKVSEDNGTSCKVTWGPLTLAGRGIIKYRLEMMKIGEEEQWAVVADDLEKPNANVPDLRIDQDYAFRVIAIDDETKEASQPSGEILKMRIQVSLTAPQDLRIKQTSETACELSWIPIVKEDDESKDVRYFRYQVEQKQPETGPKWSILNDKQKEPNYEVKDLKADSNYLFLVRAKASFGAGPPSNEVGFPVVPAKVEKLEFSQLAETKAMLSWSHDRFSGETFNIEVGTAGSGKFREVMKDIADSKVELTGLKPETEYCFRMRAKNPFTSQYSDYSAEITGKLAGMPPGSGCKVDKVEVKEVDAESNKVLVSWAKLPSEVVKTVSGFIIEMAPAGGAQWGKVGNVPNPEATQAEVYDGVDRNKDLQFRVIPVNSYGRGPESEATALPKRKPLPPKVAPSDVQVFEGKDDKSATVSWKAMPNLIGCCYSVERKKCDAASNEDWQKVADDVSESKVDVNDLIPEATYAFRVFVKNEAGCGPPSPEITLPSRVKPPSQIPVGLTVKPVDTGKALLEWTYPEMKTPLSVTLESRQLPSGTFKTLASDVKGSSYEASALKPDCEYAFRARLQNNQGQLGLPSGEVLLGKRAKPEALRGPPALKELPSAKGSYELSWPELTSGGIPAQEAPRYVIECSSSEMPSSSHWVPLTQTPIAKPPYTLTGLKPEHEYRYRIIAENSYGQSEPSMEIVRKRQVQPVAPNRITSRPLIDNDNGTSCRISWINVSQLGGDEPAWYQVERAGEDAKTWDVLVKDNRTNEYLITDIRPEDYWRFRVRACNRFGESDASPEVIRDRLVEPVPPKKPRLAPTLADVDDTTCQLSWPAISGAAEEGVVYIIERLSGSDSWTPIATDIRETSYTAKDLSPEDEYWFRVRGKNRFGLGDPSPHAIRYRRYDPKPPKAIGGAPILTDLNESSVRLSWQPSRGPGPETLYLIEICDSNSPNNWRTLPAEISDSSFDITDLPPQFDYRFRIRSKNKYGTSEASREAFRPKRYDTTAFKIPGQPQIFDVDDTSARLSWRPLEIPDILYRVEGIDETQKEWTTYGDRLVEPPYVIKDLKPDLDYHFRVRGFSDRYGILGDASVEVMRYGPYSSTSKRPPRPIVSPPTLTEIDDTTYRLSWTASREHNVRYTVEAFDSDKCEWIKLIEDNPDPWYELKGLKTELDYRFRVRATNRYGASEASLEAIRPKRINDKAPPGPIPGIPTLLDLTETSCRIMWLPVYGSKSSLVYIIEIQDRDSWIEIANDITLTSYDVKDLLADHEYFFRVRAKNQYGYSEPSAIVRRSSNVVKAKELAPRPVTSLPLIAEISDTQIHLSWEPARLPGNAKPTTILYIVEGYEAETNTWNVLVDDLDDVRVEFDNLDANREYTFRVRAKNEFGVSEPSVPATRYKKRAALRGPPAGLPAPPLIEEFSETSIHLTWIPPLYVTKAGPGEFIYIVESRDEITLRWKTISEQKEANLDIKNLAKDSDYWFRIRVKDVSSSLVSAPSPDAVKRKKVQKRPPLILPNRPRITEIDDQTIRLTWAPATARGVDDMTYIVELLVVGTTEWKEVARSVTDNNRVVKDLDPTKSYSFRIKVESEYGVSEPSTEVVLKQRKFGSDKMEIGIPPGAVSTKPMVLDLPAQKGVKLSWRPARSRQRQRYNEEDVVVSYTLQMCIMGTENWETIATNIPQTEHTLMDLNPKVNYQFRVIATNRYGSADPSPIASLIRGGDVTLQGGDRPAMPEFKCDKNVIYGVEGRTVTIAFGLTGNPIPDFSWFFNEEPINIKDHPEKYRTDFTENIVSLRIAFMSDKDVGYYGCAAWNVRGRASVGVKLQMADPPMFLEPLRDLTLTLYGDGAIECRIDGSPYPEVRWYKDWKLLPPSSRIKIRHWEPHLWTMNVSNSIHRDSGLYIVEAENVAGKIHCVANLKVEETPSQLLNLVFRPSNVEDHYHILEEIGRGSSAVIRRVIEKSTNHEFAAKFIRIFDESLRSTLKSEVETIRWLHHRHIMHIEDAFETRKFLVIVCELVTGGLLFEKIIKEDLLTERDVALWVKQLLTVLAHIHEHRIVYLDLQPENLQLCSPKHSAYAHEIKLIDFGWAMKLEPNVDTISAHCNPEFSAPEVARSEPISTSADIWSLGVLTYLMLTGESPAWAGSYEDSFKRLKSGELKLDSPVLKELSQEACDFISQCLHMDPTRRPSAQFLLEHPFIGLAERLGKGTRLGVAKLKDYTERLVRSKGESKLNLTAEVAKRRAASSARSESYVDAKSRTPTPDPSRVLAGAAMEDMTTSQTGAVDADFWDDWMDQYVCGAAEDVKEKLKYYYYKTGQTPKVTEGLSKIGVKEQMNDADWLQLALNLQNRLSRREAERRAADGKPPSFNLCINDDGYEVGRNYVLMARVDGRPNPVVTWYRNDEALHDGYRVATHSSNETGHSWLTLLMAKPHDAAVYKCVARNSFGIARCRSRVSEGDVPGSPGRPVISDVSATEAFVIWDAPVDSGNIVSRYYKVDFREEGAEKWTCAGYVIDEAAYVTGLKPNSIYRFRVSCGNRINLGNYSYGSIEVKTKESGSLTSLSADQRDAIVKARQFSYPPIVEALLRGRQFLFEHSVSSVNNAPDYFNIIDPVQRRPLEVVNGSDMIQLISNEFKIGETIKRQMGVSFSNAVEIKTAGKYLLKTASKTSAAGLKLARELELLREIECNRIEFVRAAFETPDELSTISLPVNVDLDIVQHLCFKNKYSEDEAATIIRQILDALHYLHKRRIVHSNINPHCVLVDDILSLSVRLGGFDQATVLAMGVSDATRPSYNPDQDTDVDIQFCAPELLASTKETSISYQTDVWSVAAVAFLLLSGEVPFAGPDVPAKIKAAEWRSDDLYENTTKPAFKFLVQTLKAVPLHRLTAEEAQEHRWLALTEEAITSRRAVSFATAKLRAYNNARK